MRNTLRATLVAATVLSAVICGAALYKQGPVDPAAWATVAAALAVLAAVASAWTSQRVLEMQEDALEPSLLPALDLRSRTNLAQFKIGNHGGSHAYDVVLVWDRPLLEPDGKPVALGLTPIPMIPKGESASVLVTSSHHLIAKTPDTTFTGTISFRNSRGRRFFDHFTVTAEHERNAMVLATDEQERHQDIEKIRTALEDMAKSLRQKAGG
jgi:hypothetical protein